MQVPVLIEPIVGNGYRASGMFPLDFTVEGTTREEALQKLQQTIGDRLTNGAELITVQVPQADNPWIRLEGIYKDDPLFDEWQAAIAEYRRQADQEPSAP